jgi:hypothetical protein
MDPITIALLIALGGVALGGIADTGIKHGKKYIQGYRDADLESATDYKISQTSPEGETSETDLAESLRGMGFTDSEIESIVSRYQVKDLSRLETDLAEIMGSMKEYKEIESGKPKYTDIYDTIAAEQSTALSDLYAQLDADLASRQNLLNEQLGMYNTQLSDISNDYNRMRSDIQANQYRQNAQLMDTLQSGMEKSRRNALEAGASAGIRIADNINTLLSVQNKQSNSAMETANQLSQMMINQRNAEHGIYNSMYDAKNAYANAASQNIHDKQTYKANYDAMTESKAQSAYDRAYSSYNDRLTDWDNSMSMNPLYDVRNTLKKRYTPTESSQSETGGT